MNGEMMKRSRQGTGLRGVVKAATAAAALLIAGCGTATDSGGKRVAVHGEVRLDGRPLEAGTIVFHAGAGADERIAFGHVEHGVYRIASREGPPVGTARVEFIFSWAGLAFVPASAISAHDYPPVPETVTSFGAAIAGDALYIYGGHTGKAHSYDRDGQANTLWRLDLENAKTWESLGKGPGLQGLALVAHCGKLYRLGGFAARNGKGEAHDLWSHSAVACYDPATSQWQDLSPLPEPRSSFDAAVLGDKIYVVGGWQMAGGEEEAKWHTTACALDLTAAAPQWQSVPQPPFQRRALAVAAHAGRIYAIGGMQPKGGPTTRTDIFDSATGKWSEGPSLQGEGMDGFGASAFATGGRLYLSTYSGLLQRLAADGKSWEVVRKLERARFFHRLLPLSDGQLIAVGGASMEAGKFEEVDVIDVRDAAQP